MESVVEKLLVVKHCFHKLHRKLKTVQIKSVMGPQYYQISYNSTL